MKRRQSGFTLIEGMIAALVLTVAVVGFAASQMVATRGANLALQRNIATALGNDLIDRVRRSLDVATTGALNFSGAPPMSGDCKTSSCTPEQRGRYDMRMWYQNMTEQLSNASAALSCAGTCEVGQAMTIVIAYDAFQLGATGACVPEGTSGYNKNTNRVCMTMRFVP